MDFDSTIQLIEKGDIFEASQVVGEFLEKNPEEEEFISGFFSLRYWLNRENFYNKLTDEKIKILIENWGIFEDKLKEKNYKFGIITLELKKFLFKKITNYYKNKFENEGINSSDYPILINLSEHLINLKNFKAAKEILTYCKRLNSSDEYIYFLIGDVLCLESEYLGDQELLLQGLSFFRDGLIINFEKFPIKKIQSRILKDLIKQISFGSESEEKIKYWLPVYLFLKSFYPELRKLTVDELLEIEEEIEHLEKEIQRASKKFFDKIQARLIFLYLVILHNLYFFYDNQERFQKILYSLENLNSYIFNEVIKILERFENITK